MSYHKPLLPLRAMKRILGYFAWMPCVTLFLVAGCDTDAVTEDAAPTLEDIDPKVASEDLIEGLKNQLPGDVHIVVDEMPTLIGGLSAVMEALEYPASAKDAGIEGRVYVSFTVDVEGKPTDVTVTRSDDDALSQAAVDAVEQQRFTPGKQDGVPVRVRYTLPVSFKLQP